MWYPLLKLNLPLIWHLPKSFVDGFPNMALPNVQLPQMWYSPKYNLQCSPKKALLFVCNSWLPANVRYRTWYRTYSTLYRYAYSYASACTASTMYCTVQVQYRYNVRYSTYSTIIKTSTGCHFGRTCISTVPATGHRCHITEWQADVMNSCGGKE